MTLNITPSVVLDALKIGASTRTKRSLDIVYQVCSEQYNRGSLDFSIGTIGRLSAAEGGPATQSIRNKEGLKYREIISAWAEYCDGHKRKPAVAKVSKLDDEILSQISDAATRAMVGVILAENKKLRTENSLLKNQADIVIDMRHTPTPPDRNRNPTTENYFSLLPLELQALKEAISEGSMARNGWELDSGTGRVTKNGLTLFKAGFATAIQKILVSAQG